MYLKTASCHAPCGALTVDFLEGRRERYVRPARLFLGLLAAYFFIMFCFPDLKQKEHDAEVDQLTKGYLSATQKGNRHAASASEQAPAADAWKKYQSGFDYSVALIARHWPNARVKQKASAFLAQSDQARIDQAVTEKYNATHTALLVAVPVFALFLKLLFFRQRITYGVHLLFSMNYFTFVLLMGLLLVATPFTFQIWATWVYIGYGGLAIRNVYFCTWWSAIWRSLVLITLFGAIILFLSNFVGALGMLLQ